MQFPDKPKFPRNVLFANSDIGELKNKPEGTVTEKELKEVLRRYNLRDALIILGQISTRVFNDNSEYRIGRAAVREPNTGVFITQFALAYLATALITSGANDHKSKHLGEKENVLTLLNIYSNSLIFPEIKHENGKTFTRKDFASSLVRMYGEQFEYQFDYMHLIARSLVIFLDMINVVTPQKSEQYNVIFERETGLTLNDYFCLVMAVWAASQKTATFRKEVLTEAQIPSMQSVLTDEKVTNFLDILAVDYKTFRDEDAVANENLGKEYTKTRFNPLLVYPIIKTDRVETDPYVIPNTLAFLKRGYGGLYWWFHRFFEKDGNQQDFRNYFGMVFEQYVGRILKYAYGEQNVHPEIVYPKGKYIDWWVEQGDTVYLFEAKAYQFALPTKQTGDIELLAKEVKSKIVKSIKQVYGRLSEIDSYNELSALRGKRTVPIVVFMEIPLASGHLYKELIDEELQTLENEGFVGIKDSKIHFLNIEELEFYGDVVNIAPIEDIFSGYENDLRESFTSIIQKKLGRWPKNPYLEKEYSRFWKENWTYEKT